MDTIEDRGYTITITIDDADDNPVEWDSPEDRGAVYALHHNRYNLPYEIEADTSDYDSWTALAEAVTGPGGELEDYPAYKFVRWYEHGGIAVSLRDTEDGGGWDAGIAGVIFGTTPDAIESTFYTFKHYVEGTIYCVTVSDPDGDEIDSLGCIFGYDQAELEGMAIVTYALSQPRSGHKPRHASAYHGR